MKRAALSALVIAAVVISGCAKLLQDDFESYTAGEVPGGSIPGSPACDAIETVGAATQFSVGPTNAIAGNQSLNFEPAFADEVSRIDFLPCEPSGNDHSIRFRWRGRFQGPSSSPGVQVRITDGDDQLFRAYLLFNVTRSSIEIGSAGTVNHTIEGDFSRPHAVVARIVPGTPVEYFIAIAGEGVCASDAAPEVKLSELVDFRPRVAFLRMLWQ